jgi:MFS family permease
MAAGKFGPVRTEPGVTGGHMWTLMLASFASIGLVTGMAAMTPYVLTANLAIPESDQGKALGLLALVQEIVLILIYAPLGFFADRFGRRIVYVAGFLTLAIGYVVFPYARDLTELSAARVIYALGIGAVTGMLATVIADYGQENDRGKLTALCGFLNGLGVVLVTLLIGRLPAMFVAGGDSEVQAGRDTMALVGAICAIVAIALWFGLKKGVPQAVLDRRARGESKLSFFASLSEGIAAGKRNPRIALSYVAAFVARGDLAIVGLFAIAWGKKAAIEAGMPTAEALSAGLVPFIVAQSAALLWPAFIAVPLDRLHRLTSIAMCMLLGAIGYCALIAVDNPLAPMGLAFFALLGIGQISAFLGAQTTIAKEAPEESRGAVIGFFNFSGAVGILVLTTLGGWLFDHVGAYAPFFVVGILNGLVALAALFMRFTEKRATA